jgi:WD40 repeat protein
LASSLESGQVMVWDLRKVKLITTLNVMNKDDDQNQNSWVINKPIRSIAFDPKGKYLAYCSDAGDVRITTVKEWGETAMFSADLSTAKKADKNLKTLIGWGSQSSYIVVGCNKSRSIKLVYDEFASNSEKL